MFYDLNAKVIIESNDAHFYENKFSFKSRDSGDTSGGASRNTTPDHILVIQFSDENIEIDVIEPQRGKRARISKKYEPNYVAYT